MLYVWSAGANPQKVDDKEFTRLAADSANVLWLDLEANTIDLQQQLERLELFHPLTIERISTRQPRAFLDEFEDYLHILLQEIHYQPGCSVKIHDCHFIMGSNYLISIHTLPISALRELMDSNLPTRFFNQGSDILFYHLAAPLINSGFEALDTIADLTEDIEDRIFPKPDRNLLNELFNLKRDLITIRKVFAPMREVFSLLSRRENPFVDEQALPFMSHHYDQLIRLHEMSDTQRDIVSGALEIYLSSLSNRMNEIMTTLTVVSTIILPPTLFVGYYGMNVQMPETGWKNGFIFVIGLILVSVLGMLWYIKRKHWL